MTLTQWTCVCCAISVGLAQAVEPVEVPPPTSISVDAAWPIDKVEKTLEILTVGDGTCTAFRIHAERWVTAHHCLTSGLIGATIGALPVLEVLADIEGEMGVAVLRTAPTKGPKLKAARAARGEEVLYVGFAGGAPMVLVFPVLMEFEVLLNEEPAQIYSAEAVQGMSGGPIINRRGEVTGVILGSFPPVEGGRIVGFGPDYASLKKILEKWD